MAFAADFRFLGSLNDFLVPAKRGGRINYQFSGSPAIKDAIEALGVPHPEIQYITVHQKPVAMNYKLQPGDQVEVFPFHGIFPVPEYFLPLMDLSGPLAFVVDVHLGKLAKALRKLGFDSVYRNDLTDREIAQQAAAEDRIVLTRDVDLLKQKIIRRGYWLRSQHLQTQLEEVIAYFNLGGKFRPFTRCLACNGQLEKVAKETVWEQLPPNTRLYYSEFFRCVKCRNVYWKGSHYEDMQAYIAGLG